MRPAMASSVENLGKIQGHMMQLAALRREAEHDRLEIAALLAARDEERARAQSREHAEAATQAVAPAAATAAATPALLRSQLAS